MKTLAVYNLKGGVGKTAASVNLAYEAARSGLKTLLWDLDPQGASSFYFRVKPRIKTEVKKLLKKTHKAQDSIKATDYENLDLLPADFAYREMDLALDDLKHSRKRFLPLVETVAEEYDLFIIDCPPGLTLVNENLLIAADRIAVPVIPTPLSLRAYETMADHAEKLGVARERFLPFFSMIDRRKKLHRDVVESFVAAHRALESGIPYLSVVEQMGEARAPVAVYAGKTAAAAAYRALFNEIRLAL